MLQIIRRKLYSGRGRPHNASEDTYVNYLSESVHHSHVEVRSGARLVLVFPDTQHNGHEWLLALDHGTMDSIINLWHDPPDELRERLIRAKALELWEQEQQAPVERLDTDIANRFRQKAIEALNPHLVYLKGQEKKKSE